MFNTHSASENGPAVLGKRPETLQNVAPPGVVSRNLDRALLSLGDFQHSCLPLPALCTYGWLAFPAPLVCLCGDAINTIWLSTYAWALLGFSC